MANVDKINDGAGNEYQIVDATAVHPSDLAKVATTGSYNDLTGKPTIPPAINVDSAMSSTSTNPVQNKVVNEVLDGKVNILRLGKNSLRYFTFTLTNVIDILIEAQGTMGICHGLCSLRTYGIGTSARSQVVKLRGCDSWVIYSVSLTSGSQVFVDLGRTGYLNANIIVLNNVLPADLKILDELPEGMDALPWIGVPRAETLRTPRSLGVNLGRAAESTFDGSANQLEIPVKGTLPIANGGTGASTDIGAEYNLLNHVENLDGTLSDTRRFAILNQTKSATNGVFRWYSLSSLWNWIATHLGSLATKSSVTDGDISGTIADSHIASASTWNGKQDALSFTTADEITEILGGLE